MQEKKPTILVEMIYHEEIRSSYNVQEAHYTGAATLPDGAVVTGDGRTWEATFRALREAAAAKISLAHPEGWGLNLRWAPDGRKGFPKDIEAKIKFEDDKNAKQEAERDARAGRLRAVAENIAKSSAAPAGYTWKIHEPVKDWDRGDRCWLYAEKGDHSICIEIQRKTFEYGRGGYALGKKARLGAEEAEAGIRRLANHFGLSLKQVEIRFTSGNRSSQAGRWDITLNLDRASWLTVAHELAHNYYRRKYSFERRQGRNEHGPALARIIDRFAAWIMEQGWHLGTLAHELAVAGEARAARRASAERAAATPEPVEARIARRRAQVKRLEAKLKGTATRLKKARRSLAALERSAARGKPPRPPKPPAPHKPGKGTPRQESLKAAKALGVRVEDREGEIELFAPEGMTWSGEEHSRIATDYRDALAILTGDALIKEIPEGNSEGTGV
jgi:hypothetical protein